MLFNEKRYDFEINGKKCFFSTGKIARKSHTAVFAGMGDTVVLATINIGDPLPDSDFFPMSVEYVEKLAAAGMISSSRFVKRERFPTDEAILKARIIDRSLRPRFPSDYRNEVNVMVEVLSYDAECDPVIIGLNAISVALLLSKAPFTDPISGLRVGMKDGNFTQMFNHVERDVTAETMKLNLFVAGDGVGLTNIDANSFEVSDEEMISAMKFAISEMGTWIDAQKKFVDMHEVKKAEYNPFTVPEELLDLVRRKYASDIVHIMDISSYDEADYRERKDNIEQEKKIVIENITKEVEGKFSKLQISEAYAKISKEEMRRFIRQNSKRLDGRLFDQIREINTEVGVLPRTHGSGLFTRGLTQILTTCTLGTIRRQQIIEDMTGEDNRAFMHFYSQYPYTMGESAKYRYNPGRREIGHGALGEKAIIPVLPSKDDFPYTIVLTSEIMSENGSSSMGATCSSSLALMDAGVPIKRPVAGIALGLIYDEENPDESIILTDIRDIEDFYGYMDFKVAGTREGITAVQMDTKAKALPISIFERAIKQSHNARMRILDEMDKALTQPRVELSQYAPRVEILKIAVSKIGELIGPGGKNIKGINEKSGAEIEIEDDGSVYIFSDNPEAIEMAKKMVMASTFVPETGKIYDGEVVSVMDYGAFVEIAPNVSGLLHVSELGDGFVKDIHSKVKLGDRFQVKVLSVGDDGKMKLSRKGLVAEQK